jgi:tRNA-dihydrouridine synthase 2
MYQSPSGVSVARRFLQLSFFKTMLRPLANIMSSATKKVPIPKNGVDYRGKVVLAPMVRSGEISSRLLALHYGADLVWGPETVDKSMIGTTRQFNAAASTIDWTRFSNNGGKGKQPGQKESVIYRLHPEREGKRHIFQIGTSDPDRAVAAARLVAGDVAGIDVNAGCPKPFSVSGGMGAALLQTPDKLCAILEALVKNIVPEFDIGISVKIRLLETPEKTRALVERLVATGITGLTIHCRTTPMRPREPAIREQLSMIAEICRDAGVACLVNGDVSSRDEGLALAKQYGADGAMIARAAETNPSIFQTEEQGGKRPWREVVELYIRTCMELGNRWGNTKYLLSQMVPGKLQEYKIASSSVSYTDLCGRIGFDHLVAQAKQVDNDLGITQLLAEKEARKPKPGKKNATADAAGGITTKKERKPLSTRGVENSRPKAEQVEAATEQQKVDTDIPEVEIADPQHGHILTV